MQAQKYGESIVETILEPLLLLTPDLKVISANRSFYQTFSVSPEEIEGQFINRLGNHQGGIPELLKVLEEIVSQSTQLNDFQIEHEFPTIGRKIMLLNARRIYRQGKGTDIIILVIEDITERKRSEEALKISEARYRRLFETAQDGILILDGDTGQVSDVNPSLSETLGYSHKDVLGKKLWEIDAFNEASKTVFSELQNKGYVRYENLPLATRDGRKIDVEFVSNVYQVDQKKVIQCNIRDITRRKETEEESKIILRTAMDGFWLTDVRGNFLDVNDTYCRLIGYSHDELLAMNIHDVEALETSEETEQRIRRVKEVGGDRFETRHRCKDGRIVDLEVSVNYQERGGGRFFVFLRDITQRKRAEYELRQKTHELGEKIKELGCLYAYSKLIEKPRICLPEIFQGVVDIIPSGLRYPEIACARLIFEDQIFKTANFMETIWKQSTPIFVDGTNMGDLEIYYLGGKLEFEEGPFLEGERNLLDVLAGRLGETVKRIYTEEALQKTHALLEQRVKERTVDLVSANEQLLQEIGARKRAEESLQIAFSEIKTLKDRLEAENIYFRQEVKSKYQFSHIIGQSNAIKYVLYRAEQVAPTNATVLILGETGTGKELIAGAIHQMSPRKDQTMITVNCAALPANLIESELFGREKGAFTGADARRIGRFEVADGSTLCLDEIGELPLELQAKLLRVIEHNEFQRLGSSHTIKVDVRIIATTNRNLEKEVRKGRFRQDLYYRLNGFPLTIPPLRQRKEDIPLLVQAFIERYAKNLGKRFTSIHKDAMKALQDYPWPGNIRELENVIERAVILCPWPVFNLPDTLEISLCSSSSTLRTLEETERDQILKALSETRWRINGKKGAATILGLHPSTLRARMHKLGIFRPGTETSD